MYTQCPSCRAYFRISERQLAAAKGKVRCGKCNHIYNAQGTLIDDLPPTTAKPASLNKPSAPAVPPPSSPKVHQFENFDVTSPEPEESAEQQLADSSWQEPDFNVINDTPAVPDVDLTTSPTSNISVDEDDDDWLFGDDETEIPSISELQKNIDADDIQMVNLGADSDFSSELDEEDKWLFDDDNGLPEEDDSGVDIVLRDEGDIVSAPISEPEPVAKPEPQISYNEEIKADDEDDSDFMHKMSDYLDDDQADELISDESAAGILDEVNQQLNLAIENPAKQPAKPAQGIDLPGGWMDDFDQALQSDDELSDEEKEKQELNDAILKGLDTPAETAPKPIPPKPQPVSPELSIDASPGDHFQAGESIVLEAAEELDTGHKIGRHDQVPLRIRDSMGIEEQEPRSGMKWLGFAGGIAVLLVVLVVQAVMFRSVDIANMYPNLQATLVSLCESLPCRDSRPLDVEQIRLMSRNISQHPKSKNALLIKAAIINRANFAQRYPKIQITLSDVTGETVAQRIFYPQEYLGSLHHPFLTMKPTTPIHIALEVMDPGSAAINFEFQFL